MAKAAVVKLEKIGLLLHLTSPYRPELPPRLKALGGRWDAERKVWAFGAHRLDALRAICKEFWGIEHLDVGVGFPVEKSHSSEAVTLATRLAALIVDMDEQQQSLIFSILFEGETNHE